MTTETQVTWSKPTDPTAMTLVQARAQELINAGKEVGNAVINDGETQIVVNRFWVDTETADEWITFVNVYNPVSAVIVSP